MGSLLIVAWAVGLTHIMNTLFSRFTPSILGDVFIMQGTFNGYKVMGGWGAQAKKLMLAEAWLAHFCFVLSFTPPRL